MQAARRGSLRSRGLVATAFLAVAMAGAACGVFSAADEESPPVGPTADAGADASSLPPARVGQASFAGLTVLATGEPSPLGLAVDAERVYWADPVANRIRVVPKSGGAPEDVATGVRRPRNVALDTSYAYWAADSEGGCVPGVYRRRKIDPTDAGPSVVSTCSDIHWGLLTVALDGLNVYFTNATRGAVHAVPKEGPTASLLAGGGTDAGAQRGADGLAISGATVFWTTPPTGDVMAFDKATGSVSAVARGEVAPHAIAADDDGVYWTTSAQIRASAFRDGGEPFTLASGQNAPSAVAIDRENVYWANAGDGAIRAVPRQGGAPVELATGQAEPVSIAVDASGVYWSTAAGEVLRLARTR